MYFEIIRSTFGAPKWFASNNLACILGFSMHTRCRFNCRNIRRWTQTVNLHCHIYHLFPVFVIPMLWGCEDVKQLEMCTLRSALKFRMCFCYVMTGCDVNKCPNGTAVQDSTVVSIVIVATLWSVTIVVMWSKLFVVIVRLITQQTCVNGLKSVRKPKKEVDVAEEAILCTVNYIRSAVSTAQFSLQP